VKRGEECTKKAIKPHTNPSSHETEKVNCTKKRILNATKINQKKEGVTKLIPYKTAEKISNPYLEEVKTLTIQ
jgi:hypothetical protein